MPNGSVGISTQNGRLVGTGTVFSYTHNGVERTLKVVVPGDLNGDDRINSSDARAVLRAAAKLDILEGERALAADVDANGKINSSDARRVLRIAAKLDGGIM